ncbi:hypothetical protein PHYPO_G00137920 [Pangasianodon hypophthalmus]|uniref:Uncharacterized protein n=1 Tax=Pangasianodon hypophthalmus TaxID=310915 RepID=A0A5N5K9R5_PANHP|nr:hypothetical protein PHYPO_G00137920 [Pangasianodon hypophthalmus]
MLLLRHTSSVGDGRTQGLGSGSEGKGQHGWTRTNPDTVESEQAHTCCAARHYGKCSMPILKRTSGI